MLTLQSDSDDLLKELLESGQSQKAVALLFDLALSSARNKDFLNAEAYRDRLYALDAMALSQIVEINEVIEEEKTKAFTPGFRQMWAPFFQGLSDEEAIIFFFALEDRVFESEQEVLTQGQPNDHLFLVSQGRLKVVYSDQGHERLIHTMGRGDYFGHDTFFSMNVCTASVKTLSETSLGYIDRKTLDHVSKGQPALASNLEKVCQSEISVSDRIRQKGMDRRRFKRFLFNTQVAFRLHSPDDADSHRSFRGELWDISKGGFSFYFQSKSREATQQLIGRKIDARIKLVDKDQPRMINVSGVVQGIARQPMDEYSVHVKLERNFSNAAVKTLSQIANQSDSTQKA